MKLPTTIDEVILELDNMLAEALAEKNPLGLFAALYQKVTIKVKEGIANDRFEDGSRMENLDVVFANRYIKAYRQYTSGQAPTLSWKAVFDAGNRSDLIILQHLFLGMNVHINLDLGIAAATVSPGVSIETLKNDFVEINTLLFEILEEVQADIAKVSPFFGLIDLLAKNKDEQFAKFSMKAARQHAWLVAQRVAFVEGEHRAEAINNTDQYVLGLNQLILKPGWLITCANWVIRLVESKDVRKNIRALQVQKV